MANIPKGIFGAKMFGMVKVTAQHRVQSSQTETCPMFRPINTIYFRLSVLYITMRIPNRILAFTPLLVFFPSAHARSDPSAAGGALFPPGLQPLINRANTLLSLGQFSEAAKAYSEAIGTLLLVLFLSVYSLHIDVPEQSPTDYRLYYKRGTSYFSLSRHTPALDDFTKVLSLTSNTFDGAHLMSAKIHARDGHWSEAKKALSSHSAH